jgi:hypothetical protein
LNQRLDLRCIELRKAAPMGAVFVYGSSFSNECLK